MWLRTFSAFPLYGLVTCSVIERRANSPLIGPKRPRFAADNEGAGTTFSVTATTFLDMSASDLQALVVLGNQSSVKRFLDSLRS